MKHSTIWKVFQFIGSVKRHKHTHGKNLALKSSTVYQPCARMLIGIMQTMQERP
jgi:hypothetical protein